MIGSPSNTELSSTVLLNTFVILNKRYHVIYHSKTLIWERENKKNAIKSTLPLRDIINLKTTTTNNLIINYMKATEKNPNKWRYHQLNMSHNDLNILTQWYHVLQTIVNEEKRPKNLLLFVNPFGGRRNGEQIYRKYAEPLFKMASINMNVIVTKSSDHIRSYLMQQTTNLSQYDGVICLGGDGTVSDVINGLMFRTMTDLELDLASPAYMPNPSLPIGIIPGGSTDTIAYCLHGTTDVTTAVLHIICGISNGLDISSIYAYSPKHFTHAETQSNSTQSMSYGENKSSSSSSAPIPEINTKNYNLIKFYASIMSYGYLGDLAADSENYRWMGPRRYDWSGFKKFLNNKGYNIEIILNSEEANEEPISENSDTDDNLNANFNQITEEKCVIHCSRCARAAKENNDSVDSVNKNAFSEPLFSNSNSKIIRGNFFMISGANISCACKRSPNGFSPYSHLGDGYIDVILIKHTSLINNLRLLLTLSRGQNQIGNLPFVEIYRTKYFHFRTTTPQLLIAENDEDSVVTTNSTQATLSNINDNKLGNSSSNLSHDNTISIWNCDGEILKETDIVMRSHCQLINVFHRGIQPKPMTTESRGCLLCK